MFAASSIRMGQVDVVVAGGMESMTNAPYYLPKARQGYRMGDNKVIDGIMRVRTDYVTRLYLYIHIIITAYIFKFELFVISRTSSPIVPIGRSD
jgi:acetyl-CoA acetyltransferase